MRELYPFKRVKGAPTPLFNTLRATASIKGTCLHTLLILKSRYLMITEFILSLLIR